MRQLIQILSIKQRWLISRQVISTARSVPTLTVIIKPTDKAAYRHLVDILDEMQISYIGTYVIDKLSAEEKALLAKKRHSSLNNDV